MECIDDQKKQEDKLLYLAQTDIMTGISNRRSGEKMIERVLNNKVSGMMCLVDCDKFKSINDTYGHMTVMRSLLRLRIRYKNRVVIKMYSCVLVEMSLRYLFQVLRIVSVQMLS